MKAFAAFCLVVAACYAGAWACANAAEQLAIGRPARLKTDAIRYTRDARTDQCFAVIGIGNLSAAFAAVPCSPAVLAQVPSGERP